MSEDVELLTPESRITEEMIKDVPEPLKTRINQLQAQMDWSEKCRKACRNTQRLLERKISILQETLVTMSLSYAKEKKDVEAMQYHLDQMN